ENDPVVVDVFANDEAGADGVDLVNDVAVVGGTLTGAGTVDYNDDGTFTYTPASGEEGEVSFDYTITDGDGDTSRATVTITLAADSVPLVGTATNLTVDEDGFAYANGDESQSDPLEIDSTESLSDTSGKVTVDFGEDVPSDLAGSIVFINASNLNGQLTAGGEAVTFAVDGSGNLVGSTTSLGTVITISITNAVAGSNPGEVDYSYSATLAHPLDQNLPGDDSEASVTLSGIEFQVTDGDDGDTGEGTFDVVIFDDVP
ncbi:Ig-like domain-containing protein, partial [Alteraurantiacibacter aestuarii]